MQTPMLAEMTAVAQSSSPSQARMTGPPALRRTAPSPRLAPGQEEFTNAYPAPRW